MVPLWILVIVAAVPTWLLWIVDRRAAKLAGPTACPRCNYDRRGLAADAKCPECGTVPALPSK